MNQIRIYELAKELNISTQNLMNLLLSEGLEVTSSLQNIDKKYSKIIKEKYLDIHAEIIEEDIIYIDSIFINLIHFTLLGLFSESIESFVISKKEKDVIYSSSNNTNEDFYSLENIYKKEIDKNLLYNIENTLEIFAVESNSNIGFKINNSNFDTYISIKIESNLDTYIYFSFFNKSIEIEDLLKNYNFQDYILNIQKYIQKNIINYQDFFEKLSFYYNTILNKNFKLQKNLLGIIINPLIKTQFFHDINEFDSFFEYLNLKITEYFEDLYELGMKNYIFIFENISNDNEINLVFMNDLNDEIVMKNLQKYFKSKNIIVSDNEIDEFINISTPCEFIKLKNNNLLKNINGLIDIKNNFNTNNIFDNKKISLSDLKNIINLDNTLNEDEKNKILSNKIINILFKENISISDLWKIIAPEYFKKMDMSIILRILLFDKSIGYLIINFEKNDQYFLLNKATSIFKSSNISKIIPDLEIEFLKIYKNNLKDYLKDLEINNINVFNKEDLQKKLMIYEGKFDNLNELPKFLIIDENSSREDKEILNLVINKKENPEKIISNVNIDGNKFNFFKYKYIQKNIITSDMLICFLGLKNFSKKSEEIFEEILNDIYQYINKNILNKITERRELLETIFMTLDHSIKNEIHSYSYPLGKTKELLAKISENIEKKQEKNIITLEEIKILENQINRVIRSNQDRIQYLDFLKILFFNEKKKSNKHLNINKGFLKDFIKDLRDSREISLYSNSILSRKWAYHPIKIIIDDENIIINENYKGFFSYIIYELINNAIKYSINSENKIFSVIKIQELDKIIKENYIKYEESRILFNESIIVLEEKNIPIIKNIIPKNIFKKINIITTKEIKSINIKNNIEFLFYLSDNENSNENELIKEKFPYPVKESTPIEINIFRKNNNINIDITNNIEKQHFDILSNEIFKSNVTLNNDKNGTGLGLGSIKLITENYFDGGINFIKKEINGENLLTMRIFFKESLII